MMYALNRELEYFDMPQVRAIIRGAAKDNYKFSSIVLGIVNSDAFRKQGPAAAPKTGAVAVAAAAVRVDASHGGGPGTAVRTDSSPRAGQLPGSRR